MVQYQLQGISRLEEIMSTIWFALSHVAAFRCQKPNIGIRSVGGFKKVEEIVLLAPCHA